MSEPNVTAKPLALVVFLENVGRLHGVSLPGQATTLIDFVAEEYAKLILRLHGVYRRYDRVVILEDERANGADLAAVLIAASRTHCVDLLILAHGLPGQIVGFLDNVRIGKETFAPLLNAYRQQPDLLNLRMVWQMNCYGASLVETWRALGAQAVNGSVGVNWLPEPSLSLFLRRWLAGQPFSHAVAHSNRLAERLWSLVYRSGETGGKHPRLASSAQIIWGECDVTILDHMDATLGA
jgi:hypothetical protein